MRQLSFDYYDFNDDLKMKNTEVYFDSSALPKIREHRRHITKRVFIDVDRLLG